MVNFMSQSEFDAGGPQPSALGGAAGGIGTLASVIAQGPRMAAAADYQRAQAEHARAQTGYVGQQTQDLEFKRGQLQRRQDMATDLVKTLATPGVMGDPNQANSVLSKAYAFALADPDAAAHAGQVMGTVLAGLRMAQSNQPGAAARYDAAASAFPGGQAYQNTQSGFSESQANQIKLKQMELANAAKLKGADIVTVVPVSAQPGDIRNAQSMDRATFQAAPPGTWREISPSELQALTGPTNVRPVGAAPGTPATVTPLTTVYTTGGMTSVTPAQQQAETTDTVTVVPATAKPADISQAQTIRKADLLNAPPGTWREVTPAELSALRTPSTVRPAGAPATQPPTLTTTGEAITAGGQTPIAPAQQQAEGTPTPVVTPQGVRNVTSAATLGQQPAAKTPDEAQAQAIQATAAAAAQQQQTPPPVLPGEPPVPPGPTKTAAELYGDAARQAVLPKPPDKMTPEMSAEMAQLIEQSANRHFPVTGSRGTPGSWGPMANAEIARRADELRTRYGTPEYNSAGAAIERAIRDLQATGQLPQDEPQGMSLGRTIFGGKNVVELRAPGGYGGRSAAPAGAQPVASGAQAAPAAAPGSKPPMMHSASTGKFFAQINGRWVESDANGQPLQGQAPAQAQAAPARRPQQRAAPINPEDLLPSWLQPGRREAMRAGVPTTRQVSPARDIRMENGRRMGTVQGQRVPVDENGFPLDQAETLLAR